MRPDGDEARGYHLGMKMSSPVVIVILLTVLIGSFSLFASGDSAPFPDSAWPISMPEALGLPAGSLDQAIDAFAAQANPLSSLLVVKNGYLIAERYWGGFGPGEMTALYSATKSINALVVGIAIDRGILAGPHVTIGEILVTYEMADPLAGSVSLLDLVTMRAGFDYDEWSLPYNHPRNPYNAWTRASDRIEYVLSLPMADEPGTVFRYQTPGSQLVPRILEEITGRDFVSLATEWLFEPLGISADHVIWRLDAQGHTRVAACNMVPADVARIGLLLLREGRWDSEQLVSQAWIDASIAAHASVRLGVDFGYHWWLREAAGLRVIGAEGYGGQCLFVIPDLDLVVVTTGRFSDGPEGAFHLLRDVLLPAMTNE